MLFSLGIKIAD
jgi:hypothetical protein